VSNRYVTNHEPDSDAIAVEQSQRGASLEPHRKELENTMVSKPILKLWRDRTVTERYRSAVSLHSHTSCSQESMAFIPTVLNPFPLGRALLRNIADRHRESTGQELDFGRAFWTPPLSPQQAFQLEANQIVHELGRRPIVSITDHDNMEACSALRVVHEDGQVPYSVEWTVPYGAATFHIGVHNVPSEQARPLLAEMNAFTADPNDARLAELLSALHEIKQVLLVLNHPLNDEGCVRKPIHEAHLQRFLAGYGQWIHALELNALQPWKVNQRVAGIARELGYLVISGGDRHGCEPNGNLNLTDAGSFSEFVAEVREDRHSVVLFMPQCREPLSLRYMECIWHIVREQPDSPGRISWKDRGFYRRPDGEPQAISEICTGTYLRIFSRLVGLFGLVISQEFRPALRLMLPQSDEVAL
jgi:hypothetical protein